MLILAITIQKVSGNILQLLSKRLWKNKPGYDGSTIPGWKVETIGDDIAWMKFGKTKAVRYQPRGRFLRSCTGTSMDSN